jgi:carboxypeptidase Taq
METYDPADLIQKLTGKKLDVEPYLKYLREKYSALYGSGAFSFFVNSP